jgi:dienelactone hydrolase
VILNFKPLLIGAALLFQTSVAISPAWASGGVSEGDKLLADYFRTETAKISVACLTNVQSLGDWQSRRAELRREAAEMLGLDPMPERSALNAVVTGKIERDDFTVEKLYFQSRPHLYVTANLYIPKPVSKPAPAVLYLCGHTPVITNGVSYGNKVAYQHHGIWFARNGYVCLVLDTLQWGEIRGHHQGTYGEGAWWWNSRGYTPAGVETWNAIRGLDYLESRPEVDAERIGVTGRSGGGAYSWFLAAVDDRVKVVAPVAGITDLRNYVIDGAVDSHCDCMFLVNTYRWNYPMLAALCAPRPLLLANSDSDSLFPLDGVMRTRNAVKSIYELYGASTNFGLVIAPGPHKDTQDLQMPVFRWFNIHLKHEDPVIQTGAVKLFRPQELKVFEKIPEDQINTTIQENFVPMARSPEAPATAQAWKKLREMWMADLRQKCFAGWPEDSGPPRITLLSSERSRGMRYEIYEIQSQSEVNLRIFVMRKAGTSRPRHFSMRIADESSSESLAGAADIDHTNVRWKMEGEPEDLVRDVKDNNTAYALFMSRGIGPAAWSGDSKRQTQIRRRFMLLGQTLDGMRVWDIRRAAQAVHSLKEFHDVPISLSAEGEMAVNTLYAALFEPEISTLKLRHVPSSHRQGPDYLNVLKFLDIPEAAAMAAEHCQLQLQSDDKDGWDFLREMKASRAADLKLEWLK